MARLRKGRCPRLQVFGRARAAVHIDGVGRLYQRSSWQLLTMAVNLGRRTVAFWAARRGTGQELCKSLRPRRGFRRIVRESVGVRSVAVQVVPVLRPPEMVMASPL
ncbi:DUF3459 domain-containing protein [Nocardia sp. NBC_01329]|uniref:DUF3459 domain-containing protein n=1 Tax=Nocardia sp. NBC_01329 TaxID=2903594 RepID=UPI003FA3C489